jgi:hypothetical protein
MEQWKMDCGIANSDACSRDSVARDACISHIYMPAELFISDRGFIVITFLLSR